MIFYKGNGGLIVGNKDVFGLIIVEMKIDFYVGIIYKLFWSVKVLFVFVLLVRVLGIILG